MQHTATINSEVPYFALISSALLIAWIMKKNISRDSTEFIIFLLYNVFETRNFLFGEKILINKVFMMFLKTALKNAKKSH